MEPGFEIAYAIFLFPFASFIFGVVGQLIIKNLYIVNGIIFTLWLVLTYTVFNESFLIWVFINTAISLVGSGYVYYRMERKTKQLIPLYLFNSTILDIDIYNTR